MNHFLFMKILEFIKRQNKGVLLGLALLLIALPITLSLTHQTQDNRQHAMSPIYDPNTGNNQFLRFDGETGYATLDPLKSTASAAFTFEAWIQPETKVSNSGSPTIVTSIPDTSISDKNACRNGYTVYLTQTGNYYSINVSLNLTSNYHEVLQHRYTPTSNMPLKTDVWSHLALSVDDNNLARLFLNGKLVDSRQLPSPVCNTNKGYLLGANVEPNNESSFYKGYLDKVRFSNTARYTADFAPIWDYTTDQNTVAYYDFNNTVENGHTDGNVSYTDSAATPNKMTWSTNTVYFTASDFYIRIDGKEFYPRESNIKINSDPISSGNPNHTTLEVEWDQNGTPMRFYMYFSASNGNWQVDEIRTYDGTDQNKWIYYTGAGISGVTGTSYVSKGFEKDSYRSESGKKGYIHFGELTVFPYFSKITSTSLTPVPSTSKITINGRVMNSDGNVLKAPVTVSIKGKERGYSQSVKANYNFRFGNIPRDDYDISLNYNTNEYPGYSVCYGCNQPIEPIIYNSGYKTSVSLASNPQFNNAYVSFKFSPVPVSSTTPPPPKANSVIIQGRVLDQNGQPFKAKVRVSISGKTTNYKKSQVINSYSAFNFVNIPHDVYTVTAGDLKGYTISHNECFGCTFHSNFTEGNTATVSLTNSNSVYEDVVFQYKITPTPSVYSNACDLDGNRMTNEKDFDMLYYCAKGAINCSTTELKRGDVNNNGVIDQVDVYQYFLRCVRTTPIPPISKNP